MEETRDVEAEWDFDCRAYIGCWMLEAGAFTEKYSDVFNPNCCRLKMCKVSVASLACTISFFITGDTGGKKIITHTVDLKQCAFYLKNTVYALFAGNSRSNRLSSSHKSSERPPATVHPSYNKQEG